jgi:hypothetical protein
MLAAGVGPWGTPCNPPSEYAFKPGDKLRSTNRTPGALGAPKGSKGLISVLQEEVRNARHAIEHWTNRHQPIIFPRQLGSCSLSPPMLKVELPVGYKVLLSAPDFDEKSECSSTNSAPRGDSYAVCTYRST